MTLVAGLYKQCRVDRNRLSQQEVVETNKPEGKGRVEKEDTRKKEQQEKTAKAQDRKKKRTPFEFEKVLFVKPFLVIVPSSICSRKNQRY